MRKPEEIVMRPLETEKNTIIRENANQYVFRVVKDANKIEIRKAVEKLFNVKVVSVQTQRTPAKYRRVGRYQGRRSSWKKAGL